MVRPRRVSPSAWYNNVYFGLKGSEIWLPAGGLLDENGTPRPAWHRLHQLIRQEWRTSCSAMTDKEGKIHLQGFFGQYQVEADFRGRKQVFPFHLKKVKSNMRGLLSSNTRML